MPSIVVCYRVDNSEIEYNIKSAKIDLTNGEIYDSHMVEYLPEEIAKKVKDPSPEILDR